MGMGLVDAQNGKRTRAVPVVNVTPLVDVALVVLIIFMVVTPMMTKTFWLNLPQKKPDDEKVETPGSGSNAPLVMTVDKNGMVRVNKTVVKRSEIGERLPRMLAAKEHRVLYFDAHDALPYGRAVEVMDLCRAAGARSIALLTKGVVK